MMKLYIHVICKEFSPKGLVRYKILSHNPGVLTASMSFFFFRVVVSINRGGQVSFLMMTLLHLYVPQKSLSVSDLHN